MTKIDDKTVVIEKKDRSVKKYISWPLRWTQSRNWKRRWKIIEPPEGNCQDTEYPTRTKWTWRIFSTWTIKMMKRTRVTKKKQHTKKRERIQKTIKIMRMSNMRRKWAKERSTYEVLLDRKDCQLKKQNKPKATGTPRLATCSTVWGDMVRKPMTTHGSQWDMYHVVSFCHVAGRRRIVRSQIILNKPTKSEQYKFHQEAGLHETRHVINAYKYKLYRTKEGNIFNMNQPPRRYNTPYTFS